MLVASYVFHPKKAGTDRAWNAWDKRFWSRAEQIVAGLNAQSKAKAHEKIPPVQYDFYMSSSQAMIRRVGWIQATGVLCLQAEPGQCRNRLFSARASVTPEQLAETVILNTLRNRPQLARCRLRQPPRPRTPSACRRGVCDVRMNAT